MIAMMLGLEVASGNDALASHSEMRKTAKLMDRLQPSVISTDNFKSALVLARILHLSI